MKICGKSASRLDVLQNGSVSEDVVWEALEAIMTSEGSNSAVVHESVVKAFFNGYCLSVGPEYAELAAQRAR